MWLGFPSHPELWGEQLQPARAEAAALALALAGPGAEKVKLLAAGSEAAVAARDLVGANEGVEIIDFAFGDIWLRDTGPIFTSAAEAAAFRFNGWGGKYVLAGDESVAAAIATLAGARLESHPFVLEGGALEHDGAGLAITTRACLLNPNRNPLWREADAEGALRRALGVTKTLWLGNGLMNDHTDGHVDNLARFTAPAVVVCPMAFGREDPNAAVYDEAARVLGEAADTRGEALRVARIPSPGRIIGEDFRVAPASHMNFLIANKAVVMPSYERVASRLAAEGLQELFEDRQVIALPSSALLIGGGSFHCISQQQPA
jgi:agmatine deiminase